MSNSNLMYRTLLVVALTIGAVLCILPTVWQPLPSWLGFLKSNKVSLGLDLQGGTHLVLSVDIDQAVVNSLEVTARSVSNYHMAKQLDVVTQRVREGEGLAASLTTLNVVPDVALKMIEVGESTGALQDMLSSLADFYDEEVETSVARFVTVIEPALLVLMGLVIAVLVLALYMPLFQLSSVVNR